jgi:glutamate 5-kinase
MSNRKKYISKVKRIVIKVGTSTLIHSTGKINLTRVEKLVRTITDLSNMGKEIILVTSGAIGIGMGKLNIKDRPESIREKQALASVGQSELMHMYSKFLGEYNKTCGQILLTREVMCNKTARQNVLNIFNTLLEMRIIPIVNENDSVSVEELVFNEENIFSENDTLSALVAKLIDADLLIILSDIDGFYNGDPRKNKGSEMLTHIEKITPEIEEYAGGTGSENASGGMKTKIDAAKIALKSGFNMVLANGDDPSIIFDIIEGKDIGTFFGRAKMK